MNKPELLDRRKYQRISTHLAAVVRGLSGSEKSTISATLIVLSQEGGQLRLDHPLEAKFKPKTLEIAVNEQALSLPFSQVRVGSGKTNLIFESEHAAMQVLLDAFAAPAAPDFLADRRQSSRRLTQREDRQQDHRVHARRAADIYKMEFDLPTDVHSKDVQIPFIAREQAYDIASVQQRREWLEKKIGKSMADLGHFDENPENYSGNIENLIGTAHLPIGIAGPLRVNGQFAKGDFYVPMATTEGVLVNSYTLGMYLLTRSGGVTVRSLGDQMSIAPIFIFSNLRESQVFAQWVTSNFSRIKEWAESTTKHGRLEKVDPKILGRHVVVQFSYTTGDAMGLNMICKATEKACLAICSILKPKRYYLRSNFESNKKISSFNMHHLYGKSLIADAIIPKSLCAVLRITPEQIAEYSQTILLSGIHSGMMGNNGQFANGLTSVFIACGQDAAHVVNSHIGVTSGNVTADGDLYMSISIPNLLVGTVGGGTGLATSKACLDILGCYGAGKVNKFAEIVAATLLAGELSISAAVINGSYVDAHERFGRNRPK
jgi:hydroxymethylglutaryl-CoA reductase (NADPH)